MKYEVTLIDADIRHPMDGEMRLAIEVDGERKAVLEYHWTEEHYTARFVGHAPSMPAPAHPTTFLQAPIAAIQALKGPAHALPTDVFRDHKITFEIT